MTAVSGERRPSPHLVFLSPPSRVPFLQWSEFHVVEPHSTDVCVQLDTESPGRAPRDFPPKARGVRWIQVSASGCMSPGDVHQVIVWNLMVVFLPLSQELLRQSRLQSTERSGLWKDHEECLSQHESASTGHEGQIQISFSFRRAVQPCLPGAFNWAVTVFFFPPTHSRQTASEFASQL